MTLPKQFQKDYYLVCNICNQNFANPLKLMGRGENFLKKYGCLIFVIFFAVVVIISYATSSDDNLKADGKTVYYITEDIYAPSNEETAKEMINAIVILANALQYFFISTLPCYACNLSFSSIIRSMIS